MTKKQGYDPIEEPGLDDTQRLLQGVEPPAEGTFNLEEILAEYGSGGGEGHRPKPTRPADFDPAPEPEPVAVLEPPQPPEPVPGPETPDVSEEPSLPGRFAAAPDDFLEDPRLEGAFWDQLLAHDDTVELPVQPAGPAVSPAPAEKPKKVSPPAPEAKPKAAPTPEPAAVAVSEPARQSAPPAPGPARAEMLPEPEEDAFALSMEDIVANTVDAVKEEQAQQQAKLLKQLEKIRKKTNRGAVKKKAPARRPPPTVLEDEPAPGETAGWHKRRYKECRRSLRAAVPVLVLLWLPWVLAQMGVTLPFFSSSLDNAALCVLVPQAILCILCWPVFRAAVESLRERVWTANATAMLVTLATLLDEMTLLLLPERSDTPPLGGVAGALLVFSLWGLAGSHRGMMETLRTAAMGAPSRLADCCDAGIAKGVGSMRGFFTRVNMEDTGSQWQRLLLPVLAAASVVFAVLSSVGQGRGQDLLWCWSAILCASSSLVFPLVFFVPFGRLAAKLSRNGAAVAGQYGAAVLSAADRLVVTDGDIFPQGAAALNGMKTYGEEREQAISYAATLAVQGGGLLGRVFEDFCRGESISYQPLEHFHIHDDNGLGGMIHGETVLLGTPVFMRHQAVRLPANLPGKTPVCLAVDGELVAVFAVKYTATDSVDVALRSLRRNGLQLTLAVRDGNIGPKLLRSRFGVDVGAVIPELSERLALSDPEREAVGPNGLLYRDGLLPFVSLVAGSRRLCQAVRIGNLLSIMGSVSGVLLGFYLTFAGRYAVLSPFLMLTYLLLWAVPVLPLVWGVDKL